LALLAACNKAPSADSIAADTTAPAAAMPDANPAATVPTPANETLLRLVAARAAA